MKTPKHVEPIEVASSPCSASEELLGFTPMGDVSDVAVFVLAGGEGRRMGGGKPARLLAGRPLLSVALEAARRHGGPIAIGVRRLDQIAPQDGVEMIADTPEIAGPLAALSAGLQWARAKGRRYMLSVPCDAPFLPHDLASRLYARARPDARIVIPSSLGRLHLACGLWRTDIGPALSVYAQSGRASLTGLAEAVGYAVEAWPPGAPDPFFNVNTPDDLVVAEGRLAHPHFE
ncbi:MAG: molybdenum cofactor guanylyltransferase [Hyphomonadaceae bacterium]|nr:molybdenum cofactor guanylyltransferase [Hyphomonadaceae bacterium]